MKILSIDTSSKICTVSILEGEKLIKEISQNNGFTHSERLMPMVQELLEQTKLKLKDMDLLVCDKGPGSFTGIRIGIATIKAFTDALNIPAIGISSLEALSYNVKKDGIICSLIDAKNDNSYCGVFENKNGVYSQKGELIAENIVDILSNLKSIEDDPITFVGDGAVTYKEQIMESLPNSEFCINNDLSSYNLGIAGLRQFENQEASKQDNLLPLYLRAPKAEQIKSREEKV